MKKMMILGYAFLNMFVNVAVAVLFLPFLILITVGLFVEDMLRSFLTVTQRFFYRKVRELNEVGGTLPENPFVEEEKK
jgi:hypothetical protein